MIMTMMMVVKNLFGKFNQRKYDSVFFKHDPVLVVITITKTEGNCFK